MQLPTKSIVSNPGSPTPGRGRRREADEPSNSVLTVRLTRTQLDAFRALARQRRQSMSEAIRDLLARDHGDLGHRPTHDVIKYLPAVSDQQSIATLRQAAGAVIYHINRPELSKIDQARMRDAIAWLRLAANKITERTNAHIHEMNH